MKACLNANDEPFDYYDFMTSTKVVGKVNRADQAAYWADKFLEVIEEHVSLLETISLRGLYA